MQTGFDLNVIMLGVFFGSIFHNSLNTLFVGESGSLSRVLALLSYTDGAVSNYGTLVLSGRTQWTSNGLVEWNRAGLSLVLGVESTIWTYLLYKYRGIGSQSMYPNISDAVRSSGLNVKSPS